MIRLVILVGSEAHFPWIRFNELADHISIKPLAGCIFSSWLLLASYVMLLGVLDIDDFGSTGLVHLPGYLHLVYVHGKCTYMYKYTSPNG